MRTFDVVLLVSFGVLAAWVGFMTYSVRRLAGGVLHNAKMIEKVADFLGRLYHSDPSEEKTEEPT